MKRNSRIRFATGILPEGDGGFSDTGCHTQEGNNLCLYVDTTHGLFDRKERAYGEVLRQKKAWKGPTEFSVPMRMQKAAEGIFDAAAERYNKEFKDDTGADALPSCPGMFEDLLRWLCRDFGQWAAENAAQDKKEDAA